MSGHSKWAKIKRAKGISDQKRGAVFTKLATAVTTAAREGGGDPALNFVLRLAIDKSKAANMPKDNIQKAIEKGTGAAKDAVVFNNISYEGFLQGDIGFIIDCLTDNTNRTYAEIKKAVEGCGAILGAQNSVAWQFSEKGKITMYSAKIEKSTKFGGASKLVRVDDKDNIMMSLLDIKGVEDVEERELEFVSNDELTGDSTYPGFDITTTKVDLHSVFKEIESMGYKIESAGVVKVCSNPIEIDDAKGEKLQNLLDALDEHDDVQNVWHNVK
ncbi:MAG: YebC/PmpR family DNA-binding transcriptional regulator [bacterium]